MTQKLQKHPIIEGIEWLNKHTVVIIDPHISQTWGKQIQFMPY